MTDQEIVKPKHVRSPNYPVINLEKAVERISQLHEKYKTGATPISVVHDVWDYKKLSSSLSQCVAALKAYGLLDVEGVGDKRMLTITDSGRKIVHVTQDSPSLLQEAALGPKTYAETWEKYKNDGLPPDNVLREALLFGEDLRFNEDAVDTFIGRFRDSIAYAKLEGSDIIPSEEESGGDKPPGDATLRPPIIKPPHREPGMKTLTFALIEGDATIQVPHPMTDESFKMLLGMLNIQKPALVPLAQEPESSKIDLG